MSGPTWRDHFSPWTVADLRVRLPEHPPLAGTDDLVIEPGSAFGAGTHVTTRLALAALLTRLRPGDVVLDMGCGTGILGLAALRRGAATVHAVDTDPAAVACTRDNAVRNGLDQLVHTAAGLRHSRAFAVDLAVANMLLVDHRGVAAAVGARVRAGGTLVLSGVLTSQVPELVALYAPATAVTHASEDDWAAVVLTTAVAPSGN